MEVLHITWCGRIGGKERALYQLIRSQLKWSRYRPTIAFGQADGPYVDSIRELGCRVLDLKMTSGHDVLSIRRSRAELRPFAIHHFHSAELPIMFASICCPGAHRLYTQRAGQHSYGPLKRLQYACVSRLIRRYFHGVSGNSRHGARAGATLLHVPEKEWHITYNGMDFDLLGPELSREEAANSIGLPLDSGVVIGTSAHLRAWKRINLLLKAFQHLADLPTRLLVVGDGPDRESLEALAVQLGIRERTVFAGMQKHMGDFLQLMDMFVLPSGPGESFGNSVVEAMGTGLPSVVFADGGGVVEHVEHGRTGYVVKSVKELSECLSELVRNRWRRLEIGERARDMVRARYSLNEMVRSYDAFYATVGETTGLSNCVESGVGR